MKKNSNSRTKSGQKTKLTKARGLVQRDSKEVMAELVAKLSERLEHTIFGCPTICMKFTRTDPRLEARYTASCSAKLRTTPFRTNAT